jgi:hypothetical protein
MAAKDLDKARKLLGQEEWGVRKSKSLTTGGAWLLSLEGTDEEGDDRIEICQLTLSEMDTVRAEFPEKFRR